MCISVPWGTRKDFQPRSPTFVPRQYHGKLDAKRFAVAIKARVIVPQTRRRAARDEQIEFSFPLVIAFCSFVCSFFMAM